MKDQDTCKYKNIFVGATQCVFVVGHGCTNQIHMIIIGSN